MHFECAEKPEAQEALQRVLSFVRQFVRGEGSDPYFFEVLSGFVESLPSYSEMSLRDAERVAVLRMLAALGYVHDSPGMARFLSAEYSADILSDAAASRTHLTAAINEGISASGLA
jgi:hypothetical protein